MKLFQYWDESTPPDDVAGWMEGFGRGNPDFEHVVLHRDEADAFIAEHYGRRERAAFRACRVPAMQADLIRLCLLDVFGGVYVDADHQSLQPLSDLFLQAPQSLMFEWLGLLNNAVLLFRTPADPFIRACLQLAVGNVEARRFRSAFPATGPGVCNAVRALIEPELAQTMTQSLQDPGFHWEFPELLEVARETIPVTPELVRAYRAVTRMNPIVASLHIGLAQPAYKTGERHWLRWSGDMYAHDAPPP